MRDELRRRARWLKQESMLMLRGPKKAYVLVGALLAIGACKKGNDEELTRRLSEANDKVVSCKKEVNDLRNEVALLKKQLAEALANPNKFTLQDPEIINLIASIRESKGLTGDVK